ncbi:unnamed protein product [Pseudo-nitzschia multistriata]|uniref:Uncharacterized protein n=1 Tax=Pseudo-nitzschia multistriata TaxID=183589 RepID=A0A448ZMN3_9STRA|nr:unnamed protein product [Pseudo-nitzschia multistriata]
MVSGQDDLHISHEAEPTDQVMGRRISKAIPIGEEPRGRIPGICVLKNNFVEIFGRKFFTLSFHDMLAQSLSDSLLLVLGAHANNREDADLLARETNSQWRLAQKVSHHLAILVECHNSEKQTIKQSCNRAEDIFRKGEFHSSQEENTERVLLFVGHTSYPSRGIVMGDRKTGFFFLDGWIHDCLDELI